MHIYMSLVVFTLEKHRLVVLVVCFYHKGPRCFLPTSSQIDA